MPRLLAHIVSHRASHTGCNLGYSTVMALPVREVAGSAAKAVGSFREAIQDLLVPELRSMRVSIDALRTEMQLRDERQTKASEALLEELRLRDAHQTHNLQALSEKLDFAMDIRDRLTQVEARLPRQ